MQLTSGSIYSLVEYHLICVNFNEFVHTLSMLEHQKNIYKELLQQPLIREGLEDL